MLTHWMAVNADGQTVRFKYMRKDDFAKAMNMKRFGELKAEWKVVGNQDDSPKRRQVETELGKFEKAAAYQDKRHMDIEALANGKGVLILYKCFLRAKQAAKLGAQVFKDIAASWPTGGGQPTGVVKFTHPKMQLVRQILDEYYAQAHTAADLQQIVASFERTAQGLSADVVIADCLGRERTGPEGSPAEGVVNLKADAKSALEADLNSLDEEYRKRAAKLQKMTGEQQQQMLDSQKSVEEQYLMMKQLESGNTKSIHIEYSYIAKYAVDAMARIILHESTHKFAATGDFGYADKAQIPKLAPKEAVRNADSFAYAGMCLLRDSLVTPGQLNSEKPSALESGGLDSLLHVMIGKGRKAN